MFTQVSESEGASLAASHGIGFCEVSVADNTPNLYKAFERLLNDSKGRPVKQRKFSVSKMIGKWSFINFCYEITPSSNLIWDSRNANRFFDW